jgi:hypothetical protein
MFWLTYAVTRNMNWTRPILAENSLSNVNAMSHFRREKVHVTTVKRSSSSDLIYYPNLGIFQTNRQIPVWFLVALIIQMWMKVMKYWCMVRP